MSKYVQGATIVRYFGAVAEELGSGLQNPCVTIYDMKTCSVCAISKSESEYYLKNKNDGKLHAQCKQCYSVKRKFFAQEHYARYGEEYRQRARIRKRNLKKLRQEQLANYLSGKACEDCGFSDIRALEFDHIDPEIKRFGIARAITDCYKWELIIEEIKKCRILCSNCHRIRTARQFKWNKNEWHLGGVVTRGSAKP